MNTETRARGVHSSRPGGYTHNDAEAGLRHDQEVRGDAPGEIDIEAASTAALENVACRECLAGG